MWDKAQVWPVAAAGLFALALAVGAGAAPGKGNTKPVAWRGVHMMVPGPSGIPLFKRAVTEVLAPLGINKIILEVNYSFAYRSHPELRVSEDVLNKAQARELVAFCKENGIEVIPQFQCLGHQSWSKTTAPLLAKYPELDETPQIPSDNPGIYCRSWCPQNPKVNEIVFALMDELIDAFQPQAFHVGMDEVFLIASDQCPRCKGKSPADLFARAVKDYHQHLVGKMKLTMLMWGDRLLDDATMKYGEWESSRNGTAPAIDQIPKDIVQCDWHYEPRESYPSVPYFQEKGFRVWPSSWRNQKAAEALLDYAKKGATERMLGHLCTTWTSSDALCRALLGEAGDSIPAEARQAADTLKACLQKLSVAK